MGRGRRQKQGTHGENRGVPTYDIPQAAGVKECAFFEDLTLLSFHYFSYINIHLARCLNRSLNSEGRPGRRELLIKMGPGKVFTPPGQIPLHPSINAAQFSRLLLFLKGEYFPQLTSEI